MAFLDGRYGDLNADPLLRLGADLRLGAWTARPEGFSRCRAMHTPRCIPSNT
jgi:hypothetical protein